MPGVRQPLSAVLGAAALLLSACGTGESGRDNATNVANASQQQVVPDLPIPTPEPPLGREQLLLAASRAASDFAAGVDDKQRQQALADKNFEFRIRFGCEGPAKDSRAGLGWTFNEKSGALKVRATPTLSAKDAPVEALAGEAFEAVEGFWIRRPWLLQAACPRTPEAAPASDEAAAQSATDVTPERIVGIAQFFTATGPRTLRRSGRPYEATKRVDDGQAMDSFDLVLSGRLTPLPNGRVITCASSTTAERPVCVISVEFGNVSIERSNTHEQIAHWGNG
jgi:hypothetical protein